MKFLYIYVLLVLHLTVFSQTDVLNSYKSAHAKFDQKNYSEALYILENLTSDNILSKEIYYLKGDCYFQIKEYNDAIKNFILSYKLKNKFSLYRIAECYSHLNDANNATEYLKTYLNTKDKLLKSEIRTDKDFIFIENSKAWNELWKNEFYNKYETELDEANYLISSEKYADAYYILDNLIIKNKNRYRAFELRGDLSMISKDYKNAAKDFLSALKLRKKDITYKIKYANALFYAEKFKKAYEIYKDISASHPELTDILVNKAHCEMQISDMLSANNTLKEYLKYYPENPQALYAYGRSFEKSGDYINALINYNKCIENNDSKPEYFIGRGDIYYKTKMFENADNDYSMALDLDPKLGEVYYKRGIAKLKFNPEESCLDFEKALKLNYHKANDYLIKYCK